MSVLFTKEELERFQKGISNLAAIPGVSQISHFILASMQEVIIDKGNRLCVFPKNLLEYAEINNGVIIIGEGGVAQVSMALELVMLSFQYLGKFL